MAINSELDSLQRRINVYNARAVTLEQRALSLPPGHVLRDLIHDQIRSPGLMRSQAARERDKANNADKAKGKAKGKGE